MLASSNSPGNSSGKSAVKREQTTLAMRYEQLGIVDVMSMVQMLMSLFRRNPEHATDWWGLNVLSLEIIRCFMGSEWTNENAFPLYQKVIRGAPLSRRGETGRAFLGSDFQTNPEFLSYLRKLHLFAESLFNLQHVPGLQHRIAGFKHNDLESSLAELECARMFSDHRMELRFIRPKNQKGHDYEAEVICPGGRIVCCEFKAKSHATTPSQRSLADTIKKARQQLPEDRPGIVVIKVAESWVNQAGVGSANNKAVTDALASSDRLVAAVLVWVERVEEIPQRYTYGVMNGIYFNRASRFYGSDIEVLLQHVGKGANWMSILELVKITLEHRGAWESNIPEGHVPGEPGIGLYS